MCCPPELSEILLTILRTGLLRIRSLGWAGQPAACAIEADHIHNLPDLLSNFSEETLVHYWHTERPAFLAQIPDEERSGWESLWERLQPHVPLLNASSAAH
jgi:hypothetical protein